MKQLLFVLLIIIASVQAQQPGIGNVGGELQPYDPARLGRLVIKPKQVKLAVGQSIQLNVETFDDKGELMANPQLVWLPTAEEQQAAKQGLMPPKCASVDNGLVTGLRAGECGVNIMALSVHGPVLGESVVVTVVRSRGKKRR